MNNARILSNNAIDRATLTASSAALPVANLLTDRKGSVWRTTAGASARLTATWASAEQIGCVALPFCNLSPVATMRVRLTNEASTTNVLSAPNSFASWTKTGTSVGAAVTGPDGSASATTITATAGGGTIALSAAVAAGNYVSSIWVRRRTGAGTISIRNAANSAWLPLDVSASWVRFSNDGGAAGGTGLLSLQLAASGDAIDIAFAQVEAGSVATSYYQGTRPLGYIDTWQSYSYDSGAVLCCAAGAVQPRGFTPAQAASAYAFGGGSFACVWLPQSPAVGLAVDITDSGNLQGYIEASRMVAGPYWSPAHNPDWGSASATVLDSGKNYRTESGDLVTNIGTRSRKLAMTIATMPAADRAALFAILRANGTSYPLLVSLFPQDTDPALERDHMIWGKLTGLSAMSIACWNGYSNSLDFEEV